MNRYLLLPLLLLASCGQKQDETKKPDPPRKPTPTIGWDQAGPLCSLRTDAVAESSGVATSWERKDVYYTHNDSGDGPRFFRFSSKGEVLATFTLKGAQAIDWEDMASAKIKDKSYLYFGDIGDNEKKRKDIAVYRLREPDPRSAGGEIETYDKYTIAYPDGAHNAEALMVHPTNGDLYIVTKVQGADSQVFKLAAPKKAGSYTMREVGKVHFDGAMGPAQLVTAGDISPDAQKIVLRTYFSAYEYRWTTKFDDWSKSKPKVIHTALEPQGEAICYAQDGSLVTTSEGMPCLVSVIKRSK